MLLQIGKDHHQIDKSAMDSPHKEERKLACRTLSCQLDKVDQYSAKQLPYPYCLALPMYLSKISLYPSFHFQA